MAQSNDGRQRTKGATVSGWFGGLHQDLRFALRQVRLYPGFALAMALTLGLGMGVNTALFSVANALLLRPLPLPERDRLVGVYCLEKGFASHVPMSFADYRDLRQTRRHFADLTAHAVRPFALETDGESEITVGEFVAANYFPVLGVSMMLGRGFSADEGEDPGTAGVAVLSHGAWHRRFAADPTVLGRSLRLNGRSFTVIGVAPASFRGLTQGLVPEFWVPVGALALFGPEEDPLAVRRDRLDDRSGRWISVVGRLAPGSTIDDARQEVKAAALRLQADHPKTNRQRMFDALPAASVRVMPGVDQVLFGVSAGLLGVSGLVVLIACANAAGMLLARGMARRREVAVRLALGAPRFRVTRLLLVEGFVLAVLGSLVGVLFAALSNRAIQAIHLPLPVTLDLGLRLDFRVIGWAALLSLVTTFGVAWLPARRHSRLDAGATLKEGVGRFASRGRLARSLVVVQVTLSMILLTGAVLLLRSMLGARGVDPGFEARGVAVLELDPSLRGFGIERARQTYARLAAAAEGLPGVERVSFASHLPLAFEIRTTSVLPTGLEATDPSEWPEIDTSLVGEGYFELMRLPVVAGRGFESADRPESMPVAVVNQAFARRFWPDRDPLGQSVRVGGDSGPSLRVVGVARDAKYRTLGEEPRPFLYQAIAQGDETGWSLLVRGPREAALLPLLRDLARRIDPEVPIRGLRTLEEATSASLLLPRAGATIFGLLGVLGLALAAVGVYGIVAQLAAQRRHELGIRMALGATRRQVFELMARQGLKLAGLGIGLGLLGSLAMMPALRFMLYGVEPFDPTTFVVVIPFFLTVALLASCLPALRASRLAPQDVLRRE